MTPAEKHLEQQHFLYDGNLLPDVQADYFEPEVLALQGRLYGTALGRGATQFIELGGMGCVLRHYRRGGWMAPLLGDRYWRAELPRTRAWREWHLLAKAFDLGLPVPQPVAARVVERGLFYTADLITRHLTDTRTLSLVLRETALSADTWQAIGRCVRRFHDAGIYHADLNAHNILLGMAEEAVTGAVYLIDFDKGEQRRPASDWQLSNLARLQRSLIKLQGQSNHFYFAENDWGQFVKGWHGPG
jgi:3-deoxy-D-manno-octulosonic acid kinase